MKSFLARRKVQLTKTDWKAALVGSVGGFAGYIFASIVLTPFVSDSGLQSHSLGQALLNTSLLSMVSGAVLSCMILAFDNTQSLRGKWHRDLLRGLPLFAFFGLMSGGLGQLIYSFIGLTRAGAWMLMGAGIGVGIGLLRRDKVQARQGALGGAIGGLIGGILVDAFLLFSYTEAAFALATLFGIVIVGALIALVMRLVQSAFKEAWLVGVSMGPYEGKEYPLNTERVSIGRSELNNISLYRASELPMQSGALVFQNGKWSWQGEAVEINGQMQSHIELQPEDSLRFGGTTFRFKLRGQEQLSTSCSSTTPQLYASQAPVVDASAVPMTTTSSTGNQARLSSDHAVIWNFTGAANVSHTLSSPTRLRIGRALQNDVILNDPSVSSEHAVIEAHGDIIKVTDLGSTNGTFINERKLRNGIATLLREGDLLLIGQIQYSIARRQTGI